MSWIDWTFKTEEDYRKDNEIINRIFDEIINNRLEQEYNLQRQKIEKYIDEAWEKFIP